MFYKEKYNSQKVDKIKNTIKQKNNYRFLINTTDSFEEVNNYFESIDKKIKIKEYNNGNYMIKLPKNTNLINQTDIDNGILPTIIGNYNIIEPEIVETFSTEYLSGELVENLWGNNYIGAELFQEELSTKEKIKVGILDTGIDYNHIDIDDNYNNILSYDFVNEDTDAIDDNGHGTQVAGIIGAEVNSTGIYGVNSNSDLVSLKVLDENGLGTSYDILEAILYAKQNGIKVINMSFGGIGDPSTSSICNIIGDAKNNGIFTVVSAGNNNIDIRGTIPAGCNDSIVVGSITSPQPSPLEERELEKADFSNYGENVIYAPGVNIYTTDLNSTYKTVEGTSYSSAFVTGLIAKELAYNGTLNFDTVVNNLKNNYNLITSFDSETTNNFDGVLHDTYERFSDLKYLSIDENYVYYFDVKNQDKIYKITITSDLLPFKSEYYNTAPKIIFSNKSNFNPVLFNSGEYIDISEYNNPELIESFSDETFDNNFSISATTFQSIGKNEINYKFDQISGEKILSIPGYLYNEDYEYLYYQNRDDNYTLYRIKKDGSENIGTKIINIQSVYPYLIDEEYIYYQNRNDNYKLYRIKKDGSEITTGGTKIIDINNSRTNYEDGTYIYYQNGNDNYKLYRIKKDGSEIATGGTKIIDANYSSPVLYELDYIYYQNGNDEYKLYRIKKDGSEVLSSGIKISDNSRFQYIGNDIDYIYYLDRDTTGGIFKIKKDGSDSTGFGTKIMNAPENGFFMMGYMYINGDYIYFTDMDNQDKIYRIKNDGSELSIGATQITSTMYNQILFFEGDFIYFSSREFGGKIYRAKKDGSSEIIKINDLNSSYRSNDSDYIYYTNYNSDNKLYSYYKVKKDGTDNILSLEKEAYKSNGINLELGVREILIKVDSVVPIGTDYKFYLSNDNSNFVEVNKSYLNGVSKIDLNNILGTYYNETIYYKIELIGDYTDTSKTPIINYIELSLGNEEPLLLSDIQIYGSDGCDSSRRVTAYMDLYMGNENKVYTASYTKPNTTTIGCYRGGRLKGSKYTEHTCELQSILSTEENYSVNYECEIYERRSSSAMGGSGRTRTNYWTGSFIIDKVDYDLCGYDSDFCENVPVPTELKQEIQSYLLEKQDVKLGEKIGKNQSGSGIILSANIQDDNLYDLSLNFEVYKHGTIELIYSKKVTDLTETGTGTIILPYPCPGEFYWRVRAETSDGKTSDWQNFGSDNLWEYDFSLYEGFEPYPYGYSFYNTSVADGVLSGSGYKDWRYYFDLSGYYKLNHIVDGNKWDIFEKAFDISSFEDDEGKMIDAFESVGLNKTDAFQHGSCYGMAISSAMQYTNTGALFLKNNYSDFSAKIRDGTIWNKISPLSLNSKYEWNDYDNDNTVLETIFAFQLSQNSIHVNDIKNNAINEPLEIIKELENNPNKLYTIGFRGEKWWQEKNDGGELVDKHDGVGHQVIPYKVEKTSTGTLIYIWDNNYPFPYPSYYSSYNDSVLGYNQYISIDLDGNWEVPLYKYKYNSANKRWNGRKTFDSIKLYSIDSLAKKSAPYGFGDTDTSYTLSGSSDLYIADELGNISGFKDGIIYEEIPGVNVIVPYNNILDGKIRKNTWKQIYLPQKQDLTVKVSADKDESYDLMVAGGDYYTKISGVETSSGQVDSFIPTRENLQINFDDNKLGDYDLMIDNFQDTNTGSIYKVSMKSETGIQDYNIDWTKVVNNKEDAIKYKLDIDEDGNYDQESYFSPVPKSADETGSISGYVKSTPSNAGWKICLDENNNGQCEENKEKFVVTNNTGYYKFKDLEKGEYIIIQISKNNWQIKTPVHGKYEIYINSGQNIENLDFENIKGKGK